MLFMGKTTFYGLCVIIPMFVVGFVLFKLAEILDKVAKPLGLETYLGASLVIVLAVLVILLLSFLIGILIQKVISFKSFESKVLNQIPGYEIIATLAQGFRDADQSHSFPSVMIDLYGSGTTALGFIMEEHENERFTVFVPSSPVLTVGNVYVVQASQLSRLDVKGKEVADCLSKWGMGTKNLLNR
ncbi:MAG: DUF502 domain-containing protein [Methyloprofundus sp.]|nr:DUF502 domain-containing protein [Methyloprofundus sp.]